MTRQDVEDRVTKALKDWAKDFPKADADIADDELDDLEGNLTAAVDECRDSDDEEEADEKEDA